VWFHEWIRTPEDEWILSLSLSLSSLSLSLSLTVGRARALFGED
jgi:hypothetical protein